MPQRKSTAVRYATREEAEAARKETFRRSGKRQRHIYRELCDRLEINGRGARWHAHFKELKAAHPDVLAQCRPPDDIPEENIDLWFSTRCGYKRYWLARYTLPQLRSLFGEFTR